MLGLWLVFGHPGDIGMTIATMAIKITFYVWMVTLWPEILKLLPKFFVAVGLTASGNVIQQSVFTDPSALSSQGMAAMALVYNRIFAYSGLQALYNLPDILITGIAATLTSIAFAAFAIQVFVTILEFYALATVVVVLIPFGAIKYTAFLAEKAIAMVWSYGLKLMILSFIAGTAMPVMFRLSPQGPPTFDQVVVLGTTAWGIVILAWRAPTIATGLLYGAPQLTAESVSHAVQSSVRSIQTMVGVMGAMAGTPPTPAPVTTTQRRRP